VKLKILLFIAVVKMSLIAQVEHTPTIAQCQAHEQLWSSQLENIDRQPLSVLIPQLREMRHCSTIDHDNQSNYHALANELALTHATRMRKFLLRHDIYQQFLSEDAEGKR
jgi:hypothetical protein